MYFENSMCDGWWHTLAVCAKVWKKKTKTSCTRYTRVNQFTNDQSGWCPNSGAGRQFHSLLEQLRAMGWAPRMWHSQMTTEYMKTIPQRMPALKQIANSLLSHDASDKAGSNTIKNVKNWPLTAKNKCKFFVSDFLKIVPVRLNRSQKGFQPPFPNFFFSPSRTV